MALFWISHGDFYFEISPMQSGAIVHGGLTIFQQWTEFPFESKAPPVPANYKTYTRTDCLRIGPPQSTPPLLFSTYHATDPEKNEKFKEWFKQLKTFEI